MPGVILPPFFVPANEPGDHCCAYARYYGLSLARCPYKRNEQHRHYAERTGEPLTVAALKRREREHGPEEHQRRATFRA